MTPILKTIARTREIAEKATPGPWVWADCDEFDVLGNIKILDDKYPSISDHKVLDDGSACGEYSREVDPEGPNGKFIAHVNPQHVLAMCDALEEAVRAFEEILYQLPPGMEYSRRAATNALKSIAERLGEE